MSSERAVPMLVARLQGLAGEISGDLGILKNPELESQVQEKVIRIEQEVGRLRGLLSMGEQPARLVDDESTGMASEEWAELGVEDKILKSEVMSSLSASFHRLKDPRLKMCLLSLSVFTDNTPIKKRPLIYWWMGEGLVATEEAGEHLFEVLLSVEGFIKQPPTPNSLTVYPWTRRMLLLLAQQTGFLKYTSYPQPTPCNGNRRAFLRPSSSDGGDREGDLVTVFNVNEQYLGSHLEWVSRAQKVEVLQMGRWQDSVTHHIEAENSRRLLKGLGAQKQLKYLSLRGVGRIERLPESIGKLASLQILDLRACHNLEKLPESISNLKKLTHLDVSECYLVESMPKGLPQLANLLVLKGFVCSNKACRVAELKGLVRLRKLSIRVGNQGNEDLTCLAQFPALRILTLSWGLASSLNDVSLPTALTKLDLRYVPFQANCPLLCRNCTSKEGGSATSTSMTTTSGMPNCVYVSTIFLNLPAGRSRMSTYWPWNKSIIFHLTTISSCTPTVYEITLPYLSRYVLILLERHNYKFVSFLCSQIRIQINFHVSMSNS